jgi:hypothetical protein
MFGETKTTLNFESAEAFLASAGIWFDFFFQNQGVKTMFHDLHIQRLQPSLFDIEPYPFPDNGVAPEKRQCTFLLHHFNLQLVAETPMAKAYFLLIPKLGEEAEAREEGGHILDLQNYLAKKASVLVSRPGEYEPHLINNWATLPIKIPTWKRSRESDEVVAGGKARSRAFVMDEFLAAPGKVRVRVQCGWVSEPNYGHPGKYGVTFAVLHQRVSATAEQNNKGFFEKRLSKRNAEIIRECMSVTPAQNLDLVLPSGIPMDLPVPEAETTVEEVMPVA